MFKAVLFPTARKALHRVLRSDAALFARLVDALKLLAGSPREGKPLKGGLAGFCSFRIGEWRIIYAVEERTNTIAVADIGHRRNIYR